MLMPGGCEDIWNKRQMELVEHYIELTYLLP